MQVPDQPDGGALRWRAHLRNSDSAVQEIAVVQIVNGFLLSFPLLSFSDASLPLTSAAPWLCFGNSRFARTGSQGT